MYTITTTTSDGQTIRGKSFASAYDCRQAVYDLSRIYARNGLDWTPGYTADGLRTYRVCYDQPTCTVTVDEYCPCPLDKLYCAYRSRTSLSVKVLVQALNKADAETLAAFYISRNIRYVSDSFPTYMDDDYDYHVTDVTPEFARNWMREEDYISAVKRQESIAGIKASAKIRVPVSPVEPDLYPGDSMLVYLGNKWRLLTVSEEE